MLKMEREKGSQILTINFTKARDVQESEMTATMNFDQDKFWLSSGATYVREPHYSRSQKYVLEFLADNPDSSIETISGRADVCSANAARQAVYALTSMQKIMRTDGGGNGQKATYGLVNTRKPVDHVVQ